MKIKHFIILIVLMGVAAVVVTACSGGGKSDGVSYYTCPMHPQIRMENPGQCPICGMDLVPVSEKQPDDTPDKHEHGSEGGVVIDPAYTQNIGVLTEPAVVRDLVKIIQVHGKVAHDAELWVAQNEYVQALRLGNKKLVASAALKLEFSGLSKEWIDEIRQQRSADSSLHLGEHGSSRYVEAFVYQDDVTAVTQGQHAVILDADGRELIGGTVKSISPMADLNTRSTRVFVEADEPINARLNSFVQIRISVPLGEKFSVSRDAVLFNGDLDLVYKVLEKGRYVPVRVVLGEAGQDASGRIYHAVVSGLKEGDVVVTNGVFLIDAEARIKLGTMQETHVH